MKPFVAVGMVEVSIDQYFAVGPNHTAMFPPKPSSTLTLLRNLCVTMGEVAALPLIKAI